MNTKVSELFEQIKELALHEASELLAILAGHVSEGVSAKGDTTCPSGYYWDSTSKSCVKDVG